MKKRNYNRHYKFDIEFMGGDADDYKTETIHIHEDDKYLNRFITFLNACINKYKSGKRGSDTYYDINDYILFCGDREDREYDYCDWLDEKQLRRNKSNYIEFCDTFGLPVFDCIEWPHNEDYFGTYTLTSFTTKYIDNEGVEYHVRIEKNKS